MRQLQALRVMLDGKSVFLTGPPGAGKTYVLNEFIRRAKQQHRSVAITASTGIAATHIGGTTIHSWSGLGVRESLSQWDKDRLKENSRLLQRYNSAEILVIDEVSMLHGHRLDLVNEVAKLLRDNDEPFGGLQVILVGDLFQLPPVNRGSEVLDFVHTSEAWQELNPAICYLSEQHRQVGDGLLDLLEAMRRNDVQDIHEQLLKQRLHLEPQEQTVTRLFAHNVDVEVINKRQLQALETEAKVFNMQTRGTAAKVEQLIKSVLAPEALELKIGAEVMFVANNFTAGFVNGSRGKVIDFMQDLPIVELNTGKELRVEPHTWVLEEDGSVRAEVVQLPLRLAWAITIHKSQGMSLDAALIDLSRTFTPGMGYVALSRVRSLDGVYLHGINRMALTMHQDIYDFDRELQQASAELAAKTEDVSEGEETVEVATRPPVDEELLTSLKEWRFHRATADDVPPYIVAHNTVLEEIASHPPTSRQELVGIKGFGPKKLATYGDELFQVIMQHTHPEESKNIAAKPALYPRTDRSWTKDEKAELRALIRGARSLGEICNLLQRSEEAIWEQTLFLIQTVL